MEEKLEERLRIEATNHPQDLSRVYPNDVIELIDGGRAAMTELSNAQEYRSKLCRQDGSRRQADTE